MFFVSIFIFPEEKNLTLRIRMGYKGRNILTGTDRDMFGWLTLNDPAHMI